MNVLTNPEFNCITMAPDVTVTIQGAPLPPPYTVTSVPPGIFIVVTTTTFSLGNVPVNGNGQYAFNIITSGTCTGYGQGSFVNPTSSTSIVFSNTMVSCFGGNDGAASASFGNGSTPPFTWNWSTGSTNQTITGLTIGAYTMSITDAKNCKATRSFSISEPPEIASKFTNTLIPCFGGTISSVITTTGGVLPFTYTVNNSPIPGSTVPSMNAGLKTIITKDSQGCLMTNTLVVGQLAQQIISPTLNQPNCPKESNGSINALVSGPVAGYSYTWQPGSTNSALLNNISAGVYTVSVGDASACVTTSVFTLPDAPTITPVAASTKENCSAGDGSFTLSISGGHPPYTLNTLPVNSANTIESGLSSGSYTTYIKDAHNCIDSLKFYVGNLSTVSLSIFTVTPVECYNTCNGSVILNVQNAVQPVTYSLTGMPISTNSLVSNLCAGFYIVSAVDAIGCPAIDTMNFIQPPVFSYSATTPPSMCIGKQATLSASALGGSGTLSYFWNPGNIMGANVSVQPLATTVYSLNVYDSKGCTLAPFQVTVSVNPSITINVNNSNSGICPGTTAQITPTISGGDGNYTYNWLPGNSKEASIFVENITVPSYSLFVSDGCGSPTVMKEVFIKLHPVTKPTYKNSSENGCVPLCVEFVNTTPGSTNPVWNHGDKPLDQAGDSSFYCYEKAGNFNLRLTVTDSNSCRASYTYLNAIEVLQSPDADFVTEPGIITLNNGDNVLLKNVSSSSTFFKWYMDGEYMGSTKNLNHAFRDIGCYDIRLISENNNHCQDSTTRTICVFEGFNFYMPRAFTPNRDGINDVFLPKGTGWLYEDYRFEIFNRWGHKIFSTSNVFEGWDGGQTNDPNLPDIDFSNPNNVYAWRVRVTDNQQNKHDLKGHVTLLH